MASAQPNFPLTGGGYYNSSAFQAIPNIESIDAQTLDNRASGSAAIAIGKAFVEQILAANSGDANYTVSAVANQALPMFSYGILVAVPLPAPVAGIITPNVSTGQNEIRIRQKGTCLAFATSTANTNKAIAIGDPLAFDGAGNLTSCPASPLPGSVVALAKGALAGSISVPTLILVTVGGY